MYKRENQKLATIKKNQIYLKEEIEKNLVYLRYNFTDEWFDWKNLSWSSRPHCCYLIPLAYLGKKTIKC